MRSDDDIFKYILTMSCGIEDAAISLFRSLHF